jgi:probable HAF family extracellular repeat protein
MSFTPAVSLATKPGPYWFSTYKYVVNDLGANTDTPHAINVLGQASGHGWKYDGKVVSALTCAGNGSSIDALSINDLGTVAGWCVNNGMSQGVVSTSTGSSWVVGNTMPDGTSVLASTLTGINNDNQAVGYANDPNPSYTSKAIQLSPIGQITALDGYGTSYAYAYGVNDSGTTILSVSSPGQFTKTILSGGGTVTDIGSLGGTHTVGLAINRLGWVAGMSATAGNAYHAFLYNGSQMLDLGNLPTGTASDNVHAYGLNNYGWVVGASSSMTLSHGFVYDGSAMFDLASLTPLLHNGDYINYAVGINDAGQILVNIAHTTGGLGKSAILNPSVTGSGPVTALRTTFNPRSRATTYYMTVSAGATTYSVVVGQTAKLVGVPAVGKTVDYSGTPNATGTIVSAVSASLY